jgi:hypothetical protein
MRNPHKKSNNLPTIIILITLIIFLNIFLFAILNESKITGKIINRLNKPSELSYSIDPLPPKISQEYETIVREAITYWSKRENIKFKETTPDKADIQIQWIKEFGGKHLGYAIGNNFIEIGLGDSSCIEKWQVYSHETISSIAKHELGHVLGYNHNENPDDFMYYSISTKYNIDINEKEILHEGWYTGYPVCTKKDSAKYQVTITSEEKLNIQIVPSRQDYTKWKNNEQYQYYPECKQEETRNYKKTCRISSGSVIILENPHDKGTYSDYNIKVKEI